METLHMSRSQVQSNQLCLRIIKIGVQSGGLLRTYGQDIARIQRIADPLVLAFLFSVITLASQSHAFQLKEYRSELVILLLCSILLPLGKLYQSYRQISLWTLARRVSSSWGFVLAGLLAVGFLLKITATFSRLDVSIWAVLGWLYLLLSHVGGRKLLRWHRIHGGNTRRVVFWGSPRHAVAFYQKLHSMPFLGMELVAWFEPPNSQPMTLPQAMAPCAGGIRELSEWLSHNSVDQIYFSVCLRSQHRLGGCHPLPWRYLQTCLLHTGVVQCFDAVHSGTDGIFLLHQPVE
jgi:hypothetical protein